MDAYETTLYTAVAISLGCIGSLIVINIILLIGFNRRFFKRKEDRYITEIKTLKEERTRIAHDLHDGISSSLAGLRMELDQAGQMDFAMQLKNINGRLKDIVENVLPPDLANEDFEIFMTHYFNTCAKIHGWPIQFSYKVSSSLSSNMKMHLYLMLEEIVHNTMKHAKASKMNIIIQERKNSLEMISEDNGIGFKPGEGKKKGIGLTSLNDRAVILGGKLYCHTSPGKGTYYFVKIPIEKWNPSM
jgi:signal transduction histidine kinase